MAEAGQSNTCRESCTLDMLCSISTRPSASRDPFGFVPDQRPQRYDPASGFGLFRIHEGLGPLGGRLEVQSEPGHGAQATTTLPVRQVRCMAPLPTPERP